ncbi:hypothetical protein INT46_001477 [Mucor plumbeus]|uniref:Uncharacterized protein n=1 Tax=Mucor plumbeus TaxID=97098 RepID=A0A8H7RQ77_9FUNG|nr:hypothetical protein INT46_001477 [Mucor plumbeus]
MHVPDIYQIYPSRVIYKEHKNCGRNKVDLTPTDGWTIGDVFVDSRLCGESYQQSNAKLNLANSRNATPLDYFLFFLPRDYFQSIINNTNLSARNIDSSWKDLTYQE